MTSGHIWDVALTVATKLGIGKLKINAVAAKSDLSKSETRHQLRQRFSHWAMVERIAQQWQDDFNIV